MPNRLIENNAQAVCLVSRGCLVDDKLIEDYEDEAKMIALIATSQGVQDPEMRASGVRKWAELLAASEAKALLQEHEMDRKLQDLWETINQQAKNKPVGD